MLQDNIKIMPFIYDKAQDEEGNREREEEKQREREREREKERSNLTVILLH